MFLTNLKLAAAAVLAVALATTGVWALVAPNPTEPAPGEPVAAPNPTAQAPAKDQAAAAAPGERNVERFQLDNGLKVILRPIQGATETALLVVYGVGSDHDPVGRSGLAQFVTFVYASAAAGTKKARTDQDSARGGPENGQTGDRYTVITTSFEKKDLEDVLRDAAARMSDLRITPADLARERPLVLEMVAHMFDKYPTLADTNHARELARPTPRGGRGGGLPEHVRAITIDDVQTHWKRYYKPRNAIVALAGDFDPAQARKAITEHFGGIPAGDVLPPPGEPVKPKLGTVKEVVLKSPPADRSTQDVSPIACIAYPAPQPGSDRYVPFLVLIARLWAEGSKLGGGGVTGSPVYFTPLDDGSIVGISAKVKPGEPAAKAIGRLEAFVAKTIAPKLGDLEITAAREQIGFYLGLIDVPDRFLTENPYGTAFELARREQLGLDPAKLNRALDALTDDDLRRAAAEFFAPSRHAGVVISIEK